MDRKELMASRIDSIKDAVSNYEHETGMSAIDDLTGLYRHSVFRILLSDVVDESDRESDVFSLARLDVDRFESLNKRDGFTEGDRFLQQAGETVLRTLRNDDVAGRLRDDAFGIILRDISGVDAGQVIERVKHAIAERTEARATISAGIAAYPVCGVSSEELLSNAISALGEAELRGPDGIHVCEPEATEGDAKAHTIMVVDDDERGRELLAIYLMESGYEVVESSSAVDALQRIRRGHADLILSDVGMPEMDGYEFCRRVRSAEATRMTPFVLVTAHTGSEHRVRGIESGADDFLTKPLNFSVLLPRIKSLLRVREMNRCFVTIESVMFALIAAIEAKDNYTQRHAERVAALAAEIGRRMGLTRDGICALRLGGILHDVGKIGIGGSVLNKPGPLSDDEWEVVKSHTELGYTICPPLTRSLGTVLDIVRHHHEKLDGSSYPDGLSGDALSTEARITAVADMYDAMTTDRPYRPAMSRATATQILREDVAAGRIDGAAVDHLEEIVRPSADHKRRDEDPVDRETKSILIIEDDDLDMKLVRTILQLEGYRVLEAGDAESGILKARTERPDLVLIDIQLPGMDGITAARTLREREGFGQIPIVAISSYAMRTDIENAMDAGFVGYVTKPIDTNTFPQVIAQHLHGKR
ncbi:MAG: response regulator [Spirochaetia bacterium]